MTRTREFSADGARCSCSVGGTAGHSDPADLFRRWVASRRRAGVVGGGEEELAAFYGIVRADARSRLRFSWFYGLCEGDLLLSVMNACDLSIQMLISL
jgi:hypothetical protein